MVISCSGVTQAIGYREWFQANPPASYNYIGDFTNISHSENIQNNISFVTNRFGGNCSSGFGDFQH